MAFADINPSRSYVHAGLEAHRAGDLERAAHLYAEALLRAPRDADASHLLGVALVELGDVEHAVPHLELAAQIYRNKAPVIANLARAYLGLQRYADAEKAFRKAMRLDPSQPDFHVGTAAALGFQGKTNEAETLLRRVTARFPAFALAWLNLGHVLLEQRRFDEARQHYERTLALDPHLVDAQNNIGRAYHAQLEYAKAQDAYERCLELNPDYLPGRINLSSVVMDRGKFIEAERIAREVVARAPDATEGHTLLAAALGHQGRLIEARASHQRAAELDPHDARLATHAAIADLETGRTSEGLRSMTALVASGNASESARQVLSAWLLAHGQLQDGWAEYLFRPSAIRFREKHRPLRLVQTLAQDLSGKHVCVLREQGLGDELFFLRYLPRVIARGARVTFRATPKIASLFARALPTANIVEESAAIPAADLYVLCGDLPHAFGALPTSELRSAQSKAGKSLRDLPRLLRVYWPTIPGTLRIEPVADRAGELRMKLAKLGPAPYIGLTWRAGTAPEQQDINWLLHKEVTLSAFGEVLHGTHGTLIALQRNPGAGEIERLATTSGRPVHDMTALNEDLEGMLALLSLLDEYIGVSNTNMHLRAAAGKTARVLVPTPAEWRWKQFGLSPWFPGFVLYRQSLNGDWTPALQRLHDELARL